MICPNCKVCNKNSNKNPKEKCSHAKPHKLNNKCKATCSHTNLGFARPCIDETAVEKTGKFVKLRVREKEIRMWSKENDS